MESLLSRSKGQWKGTKKLWLAPGKSMCECSITANVTDSVVGRSAVIAYSWELEGVPQEGHLLLTTGFGKGAVQAAWVDSFHKSTGIMVLKGEFTANDTIDLMGHYSDSKGPDWGWRMIIRAQNDRTLELINYNVTPSGEEQLAIEVRLTKSED
jgi:hypothetical protein